MVVQQDLIERLLIKRELLLLRRIVALLDVLQTLHHFHLQLLDFSGYEDRPLVLVLLAEGRFRNVLTGNLGVTVAECGVLLLGVLELLVLCV